MSGTVARLRGITRSFGTVVALDAAELELRAGEVHGVLGANGAGKTTLLNVLGGMLRPDAGRITVGGAEAALASPRDAWAHGIALVHQHFTLVPRLSVLDNLALGLRHGSGSRLDRARVRADAERLVERTGLSVPLDRAVEHLGVGDRQRAEILKALLRDPRILVLDEPTAVLTPAETGGLFALLRELASEGRAVVLVAHKLDEVLGVADRVTVLRDGRTVLSGPVAERSVPELVRAMVGDEAPERSGPRARERGMAGAAGEVVARVDAARAAGVRGEVAVDGVTLEVARGEIVGIAGVEGNGQHELALLLGGRLRPQEGRCDLPDGIGFIPQDRSTEGMIGDFDLTENVALALHRAVRFRRGPWLRWAALAEAAEELRRRFRVAAPSVATPVGDLSGGNQQRVVVGRELAVATDLLVAENPTRGLDVAATAFVHGELRRLTERAGEGPGVVLVSTDLDEVLALADRVFAMSRGRLRPVPEERRTREGVGALMLAGDD